MKNNHFGTKYPLLKKINVFQKIVNKLPFSYCWSFFSSFKLLINLNFQLHASLITQSCPTIYNPLDCSLLSSSVYGIFQAILEWVSFSKESSRPLSSRTHVFCVSPALQADPLPTEPLKKVQMFNWHFAKKKKKNQKLIYQEKTEKFPWMWVLMSWKIKAVYKLFFQSNMIKFLWVFLSPTLYGTMSNKGQYGLARKEWVHKWVWLKLAPHIKQVICPLKFDVRGYQTKWFLTISKLLYKVHGSVVLNHADYLPRKSAIS